MSSDSFLGGQKGPQSCVAALRQPDLTLFRPDASCVNVYSERAIATRQWWVVIHTPDRTAADIQHMWETSLKSTFANPTPKSMLCLENYQSNKMLAAPLGFYPIYQGFIGCFIRLTIMPVRFYDTKTDQNIKPIYNLIIP